MSSKYKDIDIEYDYEFEDDLDDEEVINEIGYPVHVYFIELTKLYMKQVQWHWHPELEVIIVNHGDIYFITNDQKITLSAGQGIVINSNTMHSIESVDKDANSSMYSFMFHPAFLFGYGDVMISEKYQSPVVSSNSFQFLVLDEDDPTKSNLLDCINEVIAYNMLKKFGYELLTKAKLCEFWLQLINIVAPNTQNTKNVSVGSLDETRAKEIIVYIEEHYADKVTLEDLASHIHISKSECCRCFKRALDLTPIEYLMKYRIYMAASLIKNKDEKANSFSELAFNVGFNNASYFNKIFRQYLNCTPREYRKKINNDPNYDILHTMAL